MEKLGTENIEKVAEALKILVVAGKKVAADKKVDVADIAHIVSLVSDLSKLADAFKSMGAVLDEGKELDVAEIVSLIQLVHAKVKEVEAA